MNLTAFAGGPLPVEVDLVESIPAATALFAPAGVVVVTVSVAVLVSSWWLVGRSRGRIGGSSTLLNILGGVDVPSAGDAQVDGSDLLKLSARERVHYRRRVVGFVWQQTARNLLPYLSARENVELPMALDGRPRRALRQRATELLDQVGLADRLGHRPAQLSGGEQQRVAIAVALANEPRVLLADAVLDRVGRLQLPHDYLEALELRQRVGLTLDPDHINVWPDRDNGGDDR